MMKTLVIGLGNPILTDDGAGICAAQIVARRLPPDANVEVVELSVGGIALMEAMIGYDRVIVIDALWRPTDSIGQVLSFDVGVLPCTLNTASSHDVDLPTALRFGRSLGAPLPDDDRIQVIAITAHDVLIFGDNLSPQVASAVYQAAAQVLDLLGYPATKTAEGHAVEIQWEV
jgi:hydrogenase maturation protease